jgi:hypothetical protein
MEANGMPEDRAALGAVEAAAHGQVVEGETAHSVPFPKKTPIPPPPVHGNRGERPALPEEAAGNNREGEAAAAAMIPSRRLMRIRLYFMGKKMAKGAGDRLESEMDQQMTTKLLLNLMRQTR